MIILACAIFDSQEQDIFWYSWPYDNLNPKPTLVDGWLEMVATEIFLLLVSGKGIILFVQTVLNPIIEKYPQFRRNMDGKTGYSLF